MEQGSADRARTRRRPWLDAAALRGSLAARLSWRSADHAASLRDSLEAELGERAGFQWLSVAFALGCAAYFALPREPLLVPLVMSGAAASIWAASAYSRGAPWRIATVLAVILAGATLTKVRVAGLEGPGLERAVSTEVAGRVLDRQSRSERRPRIVLDRLAIDRIAPDATPVRIRLTLSDKQSLPPLGARVTLRARPTPVAGPATPGGYDPRRAAYFERIGGSGFVLGGWTLTAPPQALAPDLAIARLRAGIVARIMAAEPGEAGAVAAALLVGERSALSEETNESLRLSGLAHILSISGLHMMLIAGTAYFAVRAALALSPRLALTRPIRKWAALAALVVVTVYFALSGGGAATLRSYVMAGIMFAAILLDRPAISMRNLAVAAFVVLALEPESIVEPGFQMSFAAVAALTAAWEAWRDRERIRLADNRSIPGLGLLRPIGRALLGVVMTSLVAGLATAPFAAYHFERVATYSLLGNLLAAPLVSAVIMPFGLLALVAMPFGLEVLPLSIMARGIDLLLYVSDWVASLPGAEIAAATLPLASVLVMSVGLLWLCLWRLRWRLLGLPVIGLGLLLGPAIETRPDILIAPEGRQVAVRDAGGSLRASGGRPGSYVIEQFYEKEREPAPDAAGLGAGVRCDELACLLTGSHGLTVSHVRDPAAFLEDCRRAAIIVTPLAAPPDCNAQLVIDRAKLSRFGAHAIRVGSGADGLRFTVTTERSAFPRPWQAGGRIPVAPRP